LITEEYVHGIYLYSQLNDFCLFRPWSGRFNYGACINEAGEIFVLGGASSNSNYLNDVWKSNIDELSDTWEQIDNDLFTPAGK
jgi:hypothetical protein